MILKQPIMAAILLAVCSAFFACSPKAAKPAGTGSADSTTHYSVKNYIRGQILAMYGQPIVVERKIVHGNLADSSFIPISETDWDEVLPIVASSDISDPQFTGSYEFNVADENITGSRILTYSAKRPDLFTQTFQINTDPLNFKVKSIYIETRRSGFWSKISQKILYTPFSILQIQETNDPLIGATKNTRLEYRFPGDPSNDVHIVEEE